MGDDAEEVYDYLYLTDEALRLRQGDNLLKVNGRAKKEARL